MTGNTKDGVYEWPTFHEKSQPLLAFASVKTSASDWHRRLGHPSAKVLTQLVSSQLISLSSSRTSNFSCNSYQCNKNHKLPFSKLSLTSSSPLQLLYSDVWCSPVDSFIGNKYYVTSIDHFTKYIWFYPMKKKSDVFYIFIHFKALVENLFNTKIIQLYTDNGGEYLALQSFLAHNGISHLTTPPQYS